MISLTHVFHMSLLRQILRWALRLALVLAVAAICVGTYLWFTTPLPSVAEVRARVAAGNTRILDRSGQLLYEVPDSDGAYRTVVPLDAIPLWLRRATIAIEDENFYHNSGFELSGMIRALWSNLRSGAIVAGGSTITQQVVRNVLLDPNFAQQRTLERKLREIILAVKLTAQHSKSEILALYLNHTYYSDRTFGVEATSWRLFGKPARSLSLAECALIAGLPQAPALYNPLEHSDSPKERQLDVLKAMVHAGFITQSQASAAYAEPLTYVDHRPTMRAPHFAQYVIRQLDAALGADRLAAGGLIVTTTLDVDLHERAQGILRRRLLELSAPPDSGAGHNVHNGAIVVLDPGDGAILALVGSPDYNDTDASGQINAALAPRQPGSAIKPLTYAAAFERGWTPASTVLDIPSSFPTREGRLYIPQNYDRRFHGPISIREALATSSNVAAVRTLDAIGVQSLLTMAARLGITTLDKDAAHYGLPLTLGDGEVTLLELSGAYAAFANGGAHIKPYAVMGMFDTRATHVSAPDQIVPAGGAEPWLKVLATPPTPALSPQVAFLVSDILADKYSRMRAFGASSPLDIGRPAAVKTGTTNQWRDNWAVGYTPARLVGVWTGNIDGQPMEDVSGLTGAAPIWHEVMIEAHRYLAPQPFVQPSGIVERTICAEGGMLPSEMCPEMRSELFIEGTEPFQRDTTHIRVAVDKELGCQAPPGYPRGRVVERVFRVLPPEAEYWAAMNGVPSPPRERCGTSELGATATVEAPDQPMLLNPAPGAVFAISPELPRAYQRIELQAEAGPEVARLTFVVDDQPVVELTQPPYRGVWQLTAGSHRIYVEVRDTDGAVRLSTLTEFSVQE
jgi:penicillin-binding protein 1C